MRSPLSERSVRAPTCNKAVSTGSTKYSAVEVGYQTRTTSSGERNEAQTTHEVLCSWSALPCPPQGWLGSSLLSILTAARHRGSVAMVTGVQPCRPVVYPNATYSSKVGIGKNSIDREARLVLLDKLPSGLLALRLAGAIHGPDSVASTTQGRAVSTA